MRSSEPVPSRIARCRHPAVIACTALATVIAPSASRADHMLAAQHAPPPLVLAGRDLKVRVAVESSCVGSCASVSATVHYLWPVGGSAVTDEASAHHAVVLEPVVPGEDVVSCCNKLAEFKYWIEVRQPGPDVTVVRLPNRGVYTIHALEVRWP